MWMLVMFDLPVDDDANRKAANDFRHDLLDFGFERCQYSVDLRFCEGREQADTWTRRVQSVLPPGGKVYCLYFTDKQYGGSSVLSDVPAENAREIQINTSCSEPDYT